METPRPGEARVFLERTGPQGGMRSCIGNTNPPAGWFRHRAQDLWKSTLATLPTAEARPRDPNKRASFQNLFKLRLRKRNTKTPCVGNSSISEGSCDTASALLRTPPGWIPRATLVRPIQKRIDVRFNFNHVGPGLILRTDFIGMETYPVEGCYPARPRHIASIREASRFFVKVASV